MQPRFPVPEYVRTLVPYVPGKPIEETRREFRLKRVIKLASNENPRGPSPRAIHAMRTGVRQLHRYPDAGAVALRTALTRFTGRKAEEVVVGNGSNELIEFLIRAFCVPGDAIVTSRAAFIAYRICAQIQGVRTLEAPLDAQLRFDLGAMLDLVKRDARARIVFLPNPNNPTGTWVGKREIDRFLKELARIRGGRTLVVFDHAYGEYVSAPELPDPAQWVGKLAQVVVLRTFSKVYGLAGLRVGYALAHPEVTRALEKVRQPFNINALALLAAEAALGDREFVRQSVRANAQGMAFWRERLDALGIPHLPSQGNFVLADVRRGLGRLGGEVYQDALRKGVIFRPVSNYGLPDHLRISVGTAVENRIAARVLAELRGARR